LRLFLIILFSFSIIPIFAQDNLYVNSKYNFSIEIPNGWKILSDESIAIDGLTKAVSFYKTSDITSYQRSTPNFNIKIDNDENNNLQQYVEKRTEFISKNYLRLIDKSECDLMADYLCNSEDLKAREYYDLEVLTESIDTSIGKAYTITYQIDKTDLVFGDEYQLIYSEMVLEKEKKIFIFTFISEPSYFGLIDDVVASIFTLSVSENKLEREIITNQLEITKKVPDWIKNTALWYGQGKISEDEFLNAIKYLISEGIIKIE
jgi:hypothetical protein